MDVSGFGPGSLVGGRYRLVAEIGRDGAGQVWEAADTHAGYGVAIRFEDGGSWTVMELVRQAPRTDTAVMPTVPVDHMARYEADHPAAYEPAVAVAPKRNSTIAGAAGAVILLVVAVTLGVTRPWHHSADADASAVPGAPTGSAPAVADPATPSTTDPATSAPATSATTSSSSPSPRASVSAPVTIISSTFCLDASAAPGSVRSGAKVSAWTCHGGSNQKWQFHRDGTIHSLADVGLCLDAAAQTGKVLDAAQVSAWSCHGGPNQEWVWNSDGSVSPLANRSLCLDAAGPIHSGSNVTAWPCNNGANQKWAVQQ
jgi:hypothetical protein